MVYIRFEVSSFSFTETVRGLCEFEEIEVLSKAVEVTVDKKEENSYDFCLNFIQGFGHRTTKRFLTLSLAAPFAPPCLEALGLIGPRKKEKKTGFDDIS